ncbi:hypothetical protein AC482_01865 [miscellaneous Crenarchaeota group-15 archaeon DG-45]|uniref:Transmembrane protein n=1 Tax=miscellaneous Crenarchaeota group-15 archaeon DG-45 TaxID=1685127 RepID=A0A0M0BRT9_9ARCH|nr:MAG: hypothetical protein AC482_01865 [miscellaneous Crenarchaeota group-15 archaeon DG-45]
MKAKVFAGFLIYGVAAGLSSYWWWHHADSPFLLNIPGDLLGYEAYDLSIKLLGDPSSPQAHYTIPWLLRIPQVFVPVSVLLWGMIGLAIQLAYGRFKRARSMDGRPSPSP